jgi:hypothetical protein
MTYNGVKAAPGLKAFNSTVHNTRDPQQLTGVNRGKLIRDGDGFDQAGLDEEGYNMMGFDENGVNGSGQLAANFPPQFLMDMRYTAHWYQAKGVPWVAPVIISEEEVKEKYASWFAEHEAIWPVRSQVRTPLFVQLSLTTWHSHAPVANQYWSLLYVYLCKLPC